jgi:choline kinase
LAAGFGSRLRTEDDDALKPLTPVAGVPLLFRALRSLEVAGCERVTVVVGFRSEQLVSALAEWSGSAEVGTVVNDRFDLANGVSLLAAADHIGDDFVLTMADHVLDDDLMALARDHRPVPGGATLLVDRRIDEVFDLDDATKVQTGEEGVIVDIGKQLAEYDCIDTGVFVCTGGLLQALRGVLDAQGDASLSQGVAALAAAGKMHTLDIGDCFWQDVDTPEMLAHAVAHLGG